ncbi:MAG: hypothetical protein ACYC7A_22510 [Thermoanaerobaculia bacterium]
MFAAPSPSALEKLIKRESHVETVVRILDSTWEWFELIRDGLVIAPSFVDRLPPKKQDVIALVNDRTNRAIDAPVYQLRSLGSRSREDIFAELLSLLSVG